VVFLAADDECKAQISVPFLQEMLLPNMRPPRGEDRSRLQGRR